MEALHNLLRELAGVTGIRAALLVGREGFVIDAVTKSEGIDVEAVGATLSSEINSTEMVGREMRIGRMKQIIVEYEVGIIILSAVAKEAALAVVAEPDAMIGNVRYQVKKYAPDVEKLL